MWRSLLLGKLAISIAVSLLVAGYSFYLSQKPDVAGTELYSWIGVGIFFSVLAVAQAIMVVMMFRKKKFD